MIDGDILQGAIDDGLNFRIGTRGICINGYRNRVTGLWCLHVPRAFTEIHADRLSVVDDVDFFSLEVSYKEEMIADIDLSKYDVITIFNRRVKE